MPRQLPANPLLLRCGQPLDENGSESAEGLFRCAADSVKVLLKEERDIYEKLKLSVYDSIISGISTVAELTRKKYPHADRQLCAKLMPCVLLDLLVRGKPLFIYKITEEESTYALSSPQRITAVLSGDTQGLEKLAAALQRSASSNRSPFPLGLKQRTDSLRLKMSVSLMRSAADDLQFISRYNEETFFRGISEKSFSSSVLDLSEKSVRNGFTFLYAMTFYGLAEIDLFTVSGVFGFTRLGVRSKDDMRPQAASELSSRLKWSDIAELSEIADKMGARLLRLPLPQVNVGDPLSLAKNCTLYAGYSQLGKAYLTALSPLEISLVPDDPGPSYKAAKQRAILFSRYDGALMLCQSILTLPSEKKPQLSSLKGYKQAQQLGQELEQLTAHSKQ